MPGRFLQQKLLRSTAIDLSATARSVSGPVMLWHCSVPSKPGQFPSHQPGRYSYLAYAPLSQVVVFADRIETYDYLAQKRSIRSVDTGDVFSLLTEYAKQHIPQPVAVELPPFVGGLIGCISYDAASQIERIRHFPVHTSQALACFYVIDTVAVSDYHQQTTTVYAWNRDSDQELTNRLSILAADAPPASETSPPAPLRTEAAERECLIEQFSESEFVARVTTAKEYIKAGDIFQVVLSNRWTRTPSVDSRSLYATLLDRNPSPFHYHLPLECGVLVGASPEVFLRTWNSDRRNLAMRLVAGTYPSQQEDVDETALQHDQKELAEHYMLVDHCRNDIGKVAEIGSVEVTDLAAVEPYRDVFHLVSQVNGNLKQQHSVFDACRACFPIATLTGTPKIRAMEIIAELEETPRGYFGGIAFIAGANEFLDSAVIIRSALVQPTSIELRAGAGIVDDSFAEREYRECIWKRLAMSESIDACSDRSNLVGGRNGSCATRTR